MRKSTFFFGALFLVAGVMVIGFQWMNSPHRDVGAEEAQFKMVPSELFQILAAEDSIAAGYINAVVELYGVVESDDGTRVKLQGGVLAKWDTTRQHRKLMEGELLRLKGRVTAYNDLFEEVHMDGTVIVQDQED